MRKFYAFLAAALMSVSVFAAKDVVPSDEVLADYYNQGDVCVCFFVPAEMNCNNIVVTGSFNGWSSTVAECLAVKAIEGYDGWYVTSFEAEAEPDAEKGMQAKPIMLDAVGAFNWEYQIGAATAIRGGVQVVQGGYEGEIDLINYGADAPNVFYVDGWKQNPCDAVYHDYKITVISDGCNGYACPFIVGAMTNWAFVQLQYDADASLALGADVYVYNVKTAEGTPYQIVSGLWNDQGEIEVQPDWKDEAYMQKLIDEAWGRIPGEQGDNQLTHENPEIVWDLRAEDLRWARCDDTPAEEFHVTLTAPAGVPEAGIEIIGFAGWDDADALLMTAGENNTFTATITAKPSAEFKFREAGTWDNQIEQYIAENDEWKDMDNLKISQIAEDHEIVLDFSDADTYRWKKGGEQGIENVVLTEKAQKVVVDGVLYIVRDNKMFNVQGTQVR